MKMKNNITPAINGRVRVKVGKAVEFGRVISVPSGKSELYTILRDNGKAFLAHVKTVQAVK